MKLAMELPLKVRETGVQLAIAEAGLLEMAIPPTVTCLPAQLEGSRHCMARSTVWVPVIPVQVPPQPPVTACKVMLPEDAPADWLGMVPKVKPVPANARLQLWLGPMKHFTAVEPTVAGEI